MKRKNTTRNALVTSIISLLLCVSMLVGTTFAWFTDEVVTGVNTIAAGNLDVDVYYGDPADKNSIADIETLFNDVELWEPGVVAYENLTVANVGNLALKYQMALNFTNATKNDKGRTLADVLKVAVVEDGFNGNREDAHALDYEYNLSTFALEGNLEKGETSKTYGVVIYWEPDTDYDDANGNSDNDYNMKNGQTTMSIDLGINLFATQLEYENDSFDNTYDEDAALEIPEVKVETPTADAFLAALAKGETAVLTSDLTLTANGKVPAGFTSAIDLNGHTLNVGEAGIFVYGNLIVTNSVGNGSMEVTQPGTGLLLEDGSTLEVQSGVINVNGDGNTNGIMVYNFGADTTINITGGKINATGDSNAIGLYGGTTNMVVANGTLNGTIDVGNSGTLNLNYFGDTKPTVTNDDNTVVTINYNNIKEVATKDELQAALNAATGNTTIVLTDHITGDVIVSQKEGVNITIDGNSHEYDGSIEVYGNARHTGTETLTIKNVDFVADVERDFVHCNKTGATERYAHNVTIEGCTFTGTADADVVAARFRQCYNITIKDCTGTDLHSVLWTTGTSGFVVDNVKATCHSGGVSFGGATTPATVKNCEFTVTGAYGYGVRAEANGAYNLTVENCTIHADAPVLLRKATGAYTATLNGNTLTSDKGNSIVVTADDYDEGKELTAPTGNLNITVDGAKLVTSADAEGLTNAIEGGNVVLGADVTYSTDISNDVAIDLAGNTFEATNTITLKNNADLTMSGGDYVVNSTYGHVDVRPDTAEGSVVTFENVDFSYNKLNKTYGPSTNRLGSVVEICATAADAKSVVVFRGCTFDNAQVLIEGMSGKTGIVDVTFENCTFNALTSSAPIYVQNYVKGTIKVTGCTFNLECTSSTASAISVSSSSSTTIELVASDNTINATAATASGVDGTVEQVKVNGTPANIKLISSYANCTVTETGTVKTGIAN